MALPDENFYSHCALLRLFQRIDKGDAGGVWRETVARGAVWASLTASPRPACRGKQNNSTATQKIEKNLHYPHHIYLDTSKYASRITPFRSICNLIFKELQGGRWRSVGKRPSQAGRVAPAPPLPPEGGPEAPHRMIRHEAKPKKKAPGNSSGALFCSCSRLPAAYFMKGRST